MQNFSYSSTIKHASSAACIGCGTCCRNGGPALHYEDMPLLQSGALARANLVTIRAGELAFDQISGVLQPLSMDLVKIGDGASLASNGYGAGLRVCQFLQELPCDGAGQKRGACGIYAHRPSECRALLCKDTRAITALYAKDRVGRMDVLQAFADLSASGDLGSPSALGVPAMWHGIVQAHDEACPASLWHELLQELAEKKKAGQGDCVTGVQHRLHEAMQLDRAYRELAHEKGKVPLQEMPFLLGRPLGQVALAYGLSLK